MVDSCYMRLLRIALNVNRHVMWITNAELYGNLLKVSSKVSPCYSQKIENRNLRLIIVNKVFPGSQLLILKNLTCNSLYSWYFGKLTREQSEAILQKYGPGRFLVRDSESVHKPGAYTLSLK